MNNMLHTTFAKSEDGIQAVESLLYHGVRAEDISLILPQPQSADVAQTTAPPEVIASTANPPFVSAAKIASMPDSDAAIEANADVPYPPQLPPRPQQGAPRYYREEDFMASGARGYTYDALGAVIPDPVPSTKPASPGNSSREAILDAEEGTGLGLGLGLLTAMCVPGIGLIVGSGIIVAHLIAGGAVVGGIAGGIYGHLVDLGVSHECARALSHHLEGGGTTLSVTVSDTHETAEIVRILKGFGGHLI